MGRAGDIIKSARLYAGLSLRVLARRVHIAHTTLSQYERGTIEPPFAVVDRIVAACGLDMRVRLARPDQDDFALAVQSLHVRSSGRPNPVSHVDHAEPDS
jgi:transcriptional regulator with XRE-family HTH domain